MRHLIAICIKGKRIPQTYLHVVVHKVKTEPACIIILVNVKYYVLIGQIIVFIQRYVEIRELIIRLIPFAHYFQRMRAVAAYNVCVICYTVDCVFINRSINQVGDIRYRIYCRVSRIASNCRYFIIPTCEYVGAFPCDCFTRGICRYAYRRACFISFAGNYAAVIILKRYRERRQCFKMKIVKVEFYIAACFRLGAMNSQINLIYVGYVIVIHHCRNVDVHSNPAFAKVFTLMRCFVAACIKAYRLPNTDFRVVIDEIHCKPAIVIILVKVEYYVLIA